MRKIALLVIFTCILNGYLYSQPGVKVGIGLSSFRSDADKSKFKPAFQAGGFYDFRLTGNLYLQPNLLFSHEPTETIYYGENTIAKFKYKGSYITLPLMFSYRHPVSEKGKIVFDLGGYLSLVIFGNCDWEMTKDNIIEVASNPISNDRTKLEAGLLGGVGYEINNYVFSSHLKYGMNPVTEYYKDKTLVIMFSVGYRFGK